MSYIPLPTNAGKGVLIVPQVHGNILLGPTSVEVDMTCNASNTKSGLEEIKRSLNALSSKIPYDKIIRTFAGIRASSTYGDFYIKESNGIKGFYHVAGIDSPGLTAAPAIARYLVETIIKPSEPLKTNFDPIRIKPKAFHSLDEETKMAMCKSNPKYGILVCKCERK